jgi:hypothetical protein
MRAVKEPKMATRIESRTRGGFQVIGIDISSSLILVTKASFLMGKHFQT